MAPTGKMEGVNLYPVRFATGMGDRGFINYNMFEQSIMR